MESDSLAAFFTADGELAAAGQAPIVGPTAIAAHLHTFGDFHVLDDSLVADTTTADSLEGRQVGRFWQRVRLPRGDTVEVHGRFEAEWVRTERTGWRLRRLATRQ